MLVALLLVAGQAGAQDSIVAGGQHYAIRDTQGPPSVRLLERLHRQGLQLVTVVPLPNGRHRTYLKRENAPMTQTVRLVVTGRVTMNMGEVVTLETQNPPTLEHLWNATFTIPLSDEAALFQAGQVLEVSFLPIP